MTVFIVGSYSTVQRIINHDLSENNKIPFAAEMQSKGILYERNRQSRSQQDPYRLSLF